jgi:hypothetical protein
MCPTTKDSVIYLLLQKEKIENEDLFKAIMVVAL